MKKSNAIAGSLLILAFLVTTFSLSYTKNKQGPELSQVARGKGQFSSSQKCYDTDGGDIPGTAGGTFLFYGTGSLGDFARGDFDPGSVRIETGSSGIPRLYYRKPNSSTELTIDTIRGVRDTAIPSSNEEEWARGILARLYEFFCNRDKSQVAIGDIVITEAIKEKTHEGTRFRTKEVLLPLPSNIDATKLLPSGSTSVMPGDARSQVTGNNITRNANGKWVFRADELY
jgi:hypothetical protein